MHAGAYQPGSNGLVIVASAGHSTFTGLVRTSDGGTTWNVVSTDTEVNPAIVFDPTSPQTVFAGDLRSDDGGATWSQIITLDALNAEVYGICPSDSATIYAVNVNPTDTVYRSIDGGATWPVYATSPSDGFAGLDLKPTFLPDPHDCDVVYAHLDDDLARFDGTDWTPLGVLAAAGGDNFVARVAADPSRPGTLYASMHTPGRPSIFRSVDNGVTWTDVSTNLPRLGDMAITVHPATGEVFVGSQAGTWILPPPDASTTTATYDHATHYDDVFVAGSLRVLPSGATVTVDADGGFVYDPAGAFDGLASGATATDSFTYTARTDTGARSHAVVTVTVTG